MTAQAEEAAPGPAARALHRIEDGLLVVLLLAMIALAAAQILLRNLFDTGLTWSDPLLRMLVLWVGLLGALNASRADQHISVDLVARVLAGRVRSAVRALTSLFTCAVTALVAYHGGRFVAGEFDVGDVAFARLPVWLFETIIPFAFGAIALRYGLFFLAHARALVKGPAPP